MIINPLNVAILIYGEINNLYYEDTPINSTEIKLKNYIIGMKMFITIVYY